jgi:hypothetical protein
MTPISAPCPLSGSARRTYPDRRFPRILIRKVNDDANKRAAPAVRLGSPDLPNLPNLAALMNLLLIQIPGPYIFCCTLRSEKKRIRCRCCAVPVASPL